mgnify:CR=1 FL=1
MAGKIETKLAELGVTLPEAPVPAANYVPYVLTGNQVYVSGQISQGPEGLITGKLGSGLDVAAGAAAAATTVGTAHARLLATRRREGTDWDGWGAADVDSDMGCSET